MRFLLSLLVLGCAVTSAHAQPLSPEAQQMLAAHNDVRAGVGVPPLSWSDTLAGVARDWARHLIETGRFEHRPNPAHGENLYAITGGTASPRQVVDAWASERRHYDLRTNTCSAVCGHYTQIVWERTRSVGCALAQAGGRQVWVCSYDPPGNVVGRRPY